MNSSREQKFSNAKSEANIIGSDSIPQWTIYELPDRHFWNYTSSSGIHCCLPDSECLKGGQRKKCAACKIVCHEICIPKLRISCRITFREVHQQNYRDPNCDQHSIKHHWILRRYHDVKCHACGKRIQNKFKLKDALYQQCTWCKLCFHDKTDCFSTLRLNGTCSLGKFANLIIPPTWIVKIVSNGLSNSLVHRSPSNPAFTIHLRTEVGDKDNVADGDLNNMKTVSQSSCSLCLPRSPVDARLSSVATNRFPFVLKATPNLKSDICPLIVFINPRSGGNQGYNLVRKFQWHLNPRQVFNLDDGGPKLGLKLYGSIQNLRILVCGGDGTVGWLMSEIDALGINPQPPIAILPLGTGNDLARTLHWGPGYADESMKKILKQIIQGRTVSLDRWNITSNPLINGKRFGIVHHHDKDASTTMPLKVINNYFSLGSDAATALEFHESREANPDKFQSRLKNKIFYVGVGGLDIIRRTWRDLVESVELICDGVNMRNKLRDIRPHAILFLNIPKYGAGTVPWGHPSDNENVQRIDDKKIEVIGLTTASLAALQVGRHGDRICQCSTVKLKTMKVIPMQIDGEPFRLFPSEILITWRNHAFLIQKESQSATNSPMHFICSNQVRVVRAFIIVSEENGSSLDLDVSCQAARLFTTMKIGSNVNLKTVRRMLIDANRSQVEQKSSRLPGEWVFLDMTAIDGEVFSIATSAESYYYVEDILSNNNDLFLIDVTSVNLKSESNFREHTGNARNSWLLLKKSVTLRRSHSALPSRQEDSQSNSASFSLELRKGVAHSMIDMTIPIININHEIISDDSEASSSHTSHEITLTIHQNVHNNKMNMLEEDSIENMLESPTFADIEISGVMPECVPSLKDLHNELLSIETHQPKYFFPNERFENESRINEFQKYPYLNLNIEQEDFLRKKFLVACRDGKLDLVQKTIQLGVSNLSIDANGLSGLHLACKSGRLEVVQFLLANSPKCLLEFRDFKKCQTALHKAAFYHRRRICEALVHAGASLICKDGNGKLPHLLASESRDKKLALYLQREEMLQFISREQNSMKI